MSRRAHFLELVSGWVEGVGVPPARIAVQGHLELASPFPRVTTNYSAVGGGHARVWRCPEGVQLTAVGHEVVAMINDAPVHRAVLKHGDLITWADVTLRFLALDVPEHRDPGLEAAIIATPDDDACWQVCADGLLSVGDPLGERIRGLRPDDSEFLGPLMPLVTEHAALTLGWSHGFIRSAVLRSWGAVQADELLTWLLELPVARFLRTLEVELRSFASREREGGLPAVLAQVQRGLKDAPLPALEHLVLGPSSCPPSPPSPRWSARSMRRACHPARTWCSAPRRSSRSSGAWSPPAAGCKRASAFSCTRHLASTSGPSTGTTAVACST